MQMILITATILCAGSAIAFAYLYFKNRKEFARLEKMRNDFMAMMIHELRSPLTVIKSSADLILKEADNLTVQQVSELLKQMEDSASDLLEIVNDLLDVAKIEGGNIELFKRDVNLSSLLRDEADSYGRLAKDKGIELKADLPPSDVNMNIDSEQVKHILNNLLSNAIKFTTEGVITLELKDYHEYAKISVADTGVGIPDDLKKKLFNKFVQARELPVSREKGTGLGLVIAKGIVEAHGGKIWIEDNQPHGTKFIFTLAKY